MQILEVVTIGLPFCAFKILTGLAFGQYWLIAWGGVDLLINLVNLFGLLVFKRRLFDACFLSFVVHSFKRPSADRKGHWQDFGNAADVFVSFILVAVMVGGGFLSYLDQSQMLIWNVSVVLNVLGAGLSRLTGSIKNLR